MSWTPARSSQSWYPSPRPPPAASAHHPLPLKRRFQGSTMMRPLGAFCSISAADFHSLCRSQRSTVLVYRQITETTPADVAADITNIHKYCRRHRLEARKNAANVAALRKIKQVASASTPSASDTIWPPLCVSVCVRVGVCPCKCVSPAITEIEPHNHMC